jgi:signal transduction histidine kinase
MAARSASPLPSSLSFEGDSTRWRCDGSVAVLGDERLIVLHLRAAAETTRRFVLLDQQIRQLRTEVRRRRVLEEERARMLEQERALRAEAESANRLKDELLASVSHELRTPLHVIAGWVTILRTQRGEQMLERGLDTIQRNVETEAQLTEDLVDASLLFTGRMSLQLEPVDLETIVRLVADDVRPAVEEHELRLQVVAEAGTCIVNADPDRLSQVVGNLLRNAIKYTPPGGRIQVTLRRLNSHAEIQISDTGEGITADLLPYIFERFRRGDASNTRRRGGLGLGLAIVHHLVELHGGVITAHSEGTGKGSVFSINLPLPLFSRPAPAVLPEPERSAPERTLGGVRVLLVEDHEDSREILGNLLEAQGVVLTALATSTEALQAFRREAPDIVISDIEMPGEDGFTMMRKLRDLEDELERPRVPAIAVSAHTIGDARVHAMNAGFQAFLSKPDQAPELAATIHSLLLTRR